MGFQYRKSMKLGPIRVTASKRGLSYSAGLPGTRVTRRADGRIQHTASIPGTGLRYTTTSGRATNYTNTVPVGPPPIWRASMRPDLKRYAQAQAPKPRRMVIQHSLMLFGIFGTLVGFVLLPLLVLSLPCLLAFVVMSIVNLPKDLAWWREYKRAEAEAYDESVSRRA